MVVHTGKQTCADKRTDGWPLLCFFWILNFPTSIKLSLQRFSKLLLALILLELINFTAQASCFCHLTTASTMAKNAGNEGIGKKQPVFLLLSSRRCQIFGVYCPIPHFRKRDFPRKFCRQNGFAVIDPKGQ